MATKYGKRFSKHLNSNEKEEKKTYTAVITRSDGIPCKLKKKSKNNAESNGVAIRDRQHAQMRDTSSEGLK